MEQVKFEQNIFFRNPRFLGKSKKRDADVDAAVTSWLHLRDVDVWFSFVFLPRPDMFRRCSKQIPNVFNAIKTKTGQHATALSVETVRA